MLVDSHQQSADGKVHAHIARARTYWFVFAGLIFLTLSTSAVSYVHLGELNLIVAIAIATMKASLVIVFFMHMKDETKFNALIFLSALLFFGIFLAYTTNDTDHRGQIDPDNGGKIDPRTGQFANGTPPALIAAYEQEHKDAEQAAIKALKSSQDDATGADPMGAAQQPATPAKAAPPAGATKPEGNAAPPPTNDAQQNGNSSQTGAAPEPAKPATGAGAAAAP